MGFLRINKVIYNGAKYFFESPVFDKNLIVVEGDNGTGKTTFCNLIYFGLGGRVKEFSKDSDRKHKEITGDTDNYVELYISISGENYQLRRFLSENDITVTPYSVIEDRETDAVRFSTVGHAEKTDVLPIFRSATTKWIFSDWILEKLGISVVELYQGYTNFKVNLAELMRLIYHDQQPDPENIYKQIDTKTNYISDSETLRKAIFELLIGEAFSDYYESIVAAKNAEKQKLLAQNLFVEYKALIDQMRGTENVKNKGFLGHDLREKEQKLERLHSARNAFKRNRAVDVSVDTVIEKTKSSLLSCELTLSEKREELVSLYSEKAKLVSVKATTVNEISQISKIIHSHNQLNLFSADTCPYCLNKVERTSGHCVCGSEIDEKQYERFFYTAQEYNEILKAKQKTLSTIDLAIQDCEQDIAATKEKIDEGEHITQQLRTRLRSSVEKLDQNVDIESLNDIDDEILQTREEITALHQRIEMEGKLERLATDFETKRQAHNRAELEMKALENKAKLEITHKVAEFSRIYNRLMTQTLSECRSARISDENYLPIINEGEYKEASSGVSIRLMYYLTLLEMSLRYNDVPFPKFLLIDTPETAGIELANLIECMKKFDELDEFLVDYQVILTTGLNKYPSHFRDNRAIYLPTKQDALLKLKA